MWEWSKPFFLSGLPFAVPFSSCLSPSDLTRPPLFSLPHLSLFPQKCTFSPGIPWPPSPRPCQSLATFCPDLAVVSWPPHVCLGSLRKHMMLCRKSVHETSFNLCSLSKSFYRISNKTSLWNHQDGPFTNWPLEVQRLVLTSLLKILASCL